jgi:hypothetical protein
MLFIIIFLVLGLSFGYALGFPWGLLAFLIPVALTLAASNRDGAAVVLYFVVTAVGLVGGMALEARAAANEQHA